MASNRSEIVTVKQRTCYNILGASFLLDLVNVMLAHEMWSEVLVIV